MEFTISTNALIAFIALFFGVGIFLTVRTLVELHRKSGAGAPPLSLRERIRARVGPVTPQRAPLNAPLRVMVEFVCALAGFPGMGWSLSARLAPGVALMLAGPIFCWMLYPIILYRTGLLATDPYLMIKELPVLATVSALTLAVLETRAAVGRRHGRPAS
jgi:hypothetical protein